jgi:hypothetical protein
VKLVVGLWGLLPGATVYLFGWMIVDLAIFIFLLTSRVHAAFQIKIPG